MISEATKSSTGEQRRPNYKIPGYASWKGMLSRCRNPKNYRYRIYGARGIRVCERWLAFENFLLDMGPKPPGLSLDRIDSNGNYEPSNCRWATSLQQSHNQRRNRKITLEGREVGLAEESRRRGFPPDIVHGRIKSGWTPEEAFELVPRSRKDKRRGPQPTPKDAA